MAKHGGGMTWQPITYDPELNLIYVTTGNPQPVVAFKNREGANLYTASIVALERRHREDGVVLPGLAARHARLGRDADAGRLFDGVVNGQPRKLLAQASRNGKFFVLDRTTGKAIVSTEYVKTNWSLGYDEKGQPIPNPAKRPQVAGALVTPNQGGATNWFSPSFQSADRALLRQRDPRVQRLVHLRRERQPDGVGRHGSRRIRRAGATQGDRLQDRERSAGASRATAATRAC